MHGGPATEANNTPQAPNKHPAGPEAMPRVAIPWIRNGASEAPSWLARTLTRHTDSSPASVMTKARCAPHACGSEGLIGARARRAPIGGWQGMRREGGCVMVHTVCVKHGTRERGRPLAIYLTSPGRSLQVTTSTKHAPSSWPLLAVGLLPSACVLLWCSWTKGDWKCAVRTPVVTINRCAYANCPTNPRGVPYTITTRCSTVPP